MASVHRIIPLPFLLLSMGCDKLLSKDAPAAPAEEAGKAAAHDSQPAAAAGDAPKGDGHTGDAHDTRAARYGVPFAWEISPEEPLARARKFMAEVLDANETFMGQGRDHFTPFVEGEKPRATVLACADSRVQSAAWDASPENDDYTVRNLGNQLATSLGSVEYGVQHLHTPVLLIVGHTDCDAVKTVLNKSVKGKDAIANELSRISLPERRRGGDSHEWDSLTAAVVGNVDAQVTAAVAHFSPYVQSGDLTVVGAVYDFANELEEGHGRLRVLNVNGNTEDDRIDAFVEAVKEDAKKAAPKAAFGARRSTEERGRALLDGTNRLLPGSPRATVNAVSVLGNGGFDAVSNGSLRSTGNILPGTSDLKLVPGANRYANVGRSQADIEREKPPAPTGRYANVGRAAPAEGHGEHAEAPSAHGSGAHGTAPAEHGKPPADHGKPPADHGKPPADHGKSREADPPPPAAHDDSPADHGSPPPKKGLAIPTQNHGATPPARRKEAGGHGEAAPPGKDGHH